MGELSFSVDNTIYMTTTFDLFNTVFGLGEVSIKKLIDNGATTIEDLYLSEYYDTLTLPTKKYLEHYDDLQKQIPRSEVVRHRDKIKGLMNNVYKIDIVGSFRRGEAICGDIDVLFTTFSSFDPGTNYIAHVTEILLRHGYLIETLKSGSKVMNGIARLSPRGIARRVAARTLCICIIGQNRRHSFQ